MKASLIQKVMHSAAGGRSAAGGSGGGGDVFPALSGGTAQLSGGLDAGLPAGSVSRSVTQTFGSEAASLSSGRGRSGKEERMEALSTAHPMQRGESGR